MFFRCFTGLSLFYGLSVAWAAAGAWAHAYPASSIPPDGATINASPREVVIRFTEGVEKEFSRIEVKNAEGGTFGMGEVRLLAPDTLAVGVKPLGPGAYTVEWQVLSVDTHVTEGRLRFTVGAESP